WRLEGRIELVEAQEAGIRLERAQGASIATLAAQSLGGAYLVKWGGAPPRTMAAEGGLPFAITVERGRMTAEAGDGAVADEAIEGAPVTVALFVEKAGAVRF